MANNNPYDSPHKPEEEAKYLSILGKKWIRVDPETKKPHTSAKDFFWTVEDRRDAVPIGGNMNAPNMDLVVYKYWRNKTHSSNLLNDKGGVMATIEAHDSASEHNSRGEMTVPGSCSIEINSFLKQFVEDR